MASSGTTTSHDSHTRYDNLSRLSYPREVRQLVTTLIPQGCTTTSHDPHTPGCPELQGTTSPNHADPRLANPSSTQCRPDSDSNPSHPPNPMPALSQTHVRGVMALSEAIRPHPIIRLAYACVSTCTATPTATHIANLICCPHQGQASPYPYPYPYLYTCPYPYH